MIPRRDRKAFEAFVTASSDRLLRTAYLLCGDRGHAEDIVQTALLRTARRWRTADQPEAYARKVVVNLTKDRWRLLGRRPAEVPIETSADPAVARSEIDTLLDRDELLSAVRRLPAGQRSVLVLRFFDDLSVEDTAAALGCTEGTVKSQTYRALAALRMTLGPTSDQEQEHSHAH